MTAPDPASRIVVGIPTVDRPEIVARTVAALASQSRLPDLVLVSGHEMTDFGPLSKDNLPFSIDLLTGPKGTCSQRNRILDTLGSEGILLFLDDDFLIAPDFLSRLETLFADTPDIVVATGKVLADGILGPGIEFDEGQAILAADTPPVENESLTEVRNAYGCNMAIRLGPIDREGLRFDEKLPLYGWFEDVDFSIRAGAFGRVVQADTLRGVHMGTKTGRTSGLRFGYSQVANPHYLYRKGILGAGTAVWRVARNIASNLFHSVRTKAWIDHRGRLRGNCLALADLLRGRCDPEKVIQL